MVKILVVAPEFPYPPNHGGRADIWGRIKALSAIGNVTLDLAVTTSEVVLDADLCEVSRYVRNVVIYRRSNSPFLHFLPAPYQITSRRSLKKNKITEIGYDLAILEGDYVASAYSMVRGLADVVLLRVHNNEAEYFSDLGDSSNGWRMMYYKIESLKFRFFQNIFRKKVDGLLFISEMEYEKHKGASVSWWLPPPVDVLTQSVNRKPLKGRVLFVGSLFMPNNIWGLRWYLEEVHQNLISLSSEYRLVVAGNPKNTDIEWLFKYSNIEVVLEPSDAQLADLYNSANVFIAPVFHGSGVKVKVVNAVSAGLPVVTTTVGNEGTGYRDREHIIVCDDPTSFAEAVFSLISGDIDAQLLVNNAQVFLRSRYNQCANLLSIINPSGFINPSIKDGD